MHEALAFQSAAKARGVAVQIFGLSDGNARAFWNWQFLGDPPELPQDPRHADARLRCAPACAADATPSWISSRTPCWRPRAT